MKSLAVVIGGLLVAASAVASEPEPASGLMGLGFHNDELTGVEKIMNMQAEAPARKGELTDALYIRTQERLANSFDHPIREQMAESTRD